MRLFLSIFFTLNLFSSAASLPEIDWQLPEKWEVVNLDKAEAPYVIIPDPAVRILVLRLPYTPDTSWKVVKTWRDSLGLSLLTEEDFSYIKICTL